MKQVLAVIISLGLFAGCASKGFNRGALSEQLGAATKPVFDDKEIKDAYNKKPNLQKPFKVAIYFQPPEVARGGLEWRWTEDDKAMFYQVAEKLKSQGLVSDAFPLLDSLVTAHDVRSLRLAAAKHGADVLLVISGATQSDKYLNGWGATYVLLVPALFVPGSEVDTLFMTNAVLWDVKNEYLYLTAESEATTNNRYVAAFGKRDIELVNEAKTKALEKLRDQLTKSIEGKKL